MPLVQKPILPPPKLSIKTSEQSTLATGCAEIGRAAQFAPPPQLRIRETQEPGDLPGALADCNAAIAQPPQDTAPLDSRALIYLKTNQWDAAIADYNAALIAFFAVRARMGRTQKGQFGRW
jgi:hypothetical protein